KVVDDGLAAALLREAAQVQHLKRHLALEGELHATIDTTHPTACDEGVHTVLVRDRLAEERVAIAGVDADHERAWILPRVPSLGHGTHLFAQRAASRALWPAGPWRHGGAPATSWATWPAPPSASTPGT